MNKITFYKLVKLGINSGILLCFFILPEGLLPLSILSVIMYFVSKENSYRQLEKRYKFHLPRWDSILCIVAICLTLFSSLITPSASTKFSEEELFNRLEEAGYTEEEIEDIIVDYQDRINSDEEELSKFQQVLSLMTSNPERSSNRPSDSLGGKSGGMGRPGVTSISLPLIINSVASLINKSIVLIVGILGTISSYRIKEEY